MTRSQPAAPRGRTGPSGPCVLVPTLDGRVCEGAALATFRLGADAQGTWLGTESPPVPGCGGGAADAAPLEALATGLERGRCLPGSGWAGFLSYGLGRWSEPRTGLGVDRTLPLGEFHRVGPGVGGFIEPDARPRGLVRPVQGRGSYMSAVERVLGYIRAGDIYQANVAHQLRGLVSGSGLGLFAALARGACPRHGMGFVGARLDGGVGYAVLSLSPELFLSFDAETRRLTTRPMKGTRPGAGDPAELREAPKDRAELAMIVDLMRNDLGRVCEFGSVRVEVPREIEHHGGGPGAVLQATSTVSGVVRPGLGLGEILSATFPPGSVTGTPKIRAMQVIDELEPFDRGPYCGCIGTIGDDGSFELAVSIRTAVVRGPVDEATGEFVDAELTYCVGAGIVADSDPESEWEETLAKARVLEPVFGLDV